MDKICEELDETKAELEKLRAYYRSKAELSENLKRAHNEQLIKIQEANSKLEKQAQELNEKTEEIFAVKHMHEDVKRSLTEKESIIKHLSAANDKLRGDFGEKYQKLEEQNRELVFALDEANEKNIDQEQKINVLTAEMEGLKGLLSISKNKCSEAEKRAKASKELKERDGVLRKLEEDRRKFEDKLKWRNEQFKHLEEAHEKLRNEFRAAKEEWQQEKSTLVDEICSLQTNLDSQVRISEDLQKKLKMCNQALAHEESRRKYLEVEVSEYKTRFDNVFTECQDAKSQLECLTTRRDQEIAGLRHSLSTKETFYREVEYRAGKLEQENQELLTSLKELQEAQIHHAGGSSLTKLRNKLKSVEQTHRDCSTNLRAKEAEWGSQLEKIAADLNNCKSELEVKDAAIDELKMELEGCHSLMMQLRMQNEESCVMLLVLKSGISEAQLKLTDVEAEIGFCNKEREEIVSRLMKQLETKDAALAKAQKDINEERERAASLLMKVESLGDIEQQQLVMHEELERYKVMLEESSKCQSRVKEQALRMEIESKEKLGAACDALDRAVAELAEERERASSLSRRVDSLNHIEEQQLLMQKELDHCKELLAESFRCRVHLEEQALQMESDSKRKLEEVCKALGSVNSELVEERERATTLSRRLELLDHVEEEKQVMQKEIENYKELLEESFKCQLQLEEQALQKESDANRKLEEVHDALGLANSQLVEKICEGHEIEFESWIWKSIAERLKADLGESQDLRKELEASLLAQTEDGEITKHEKDDLLCKLEEKDRRVSNLQKQILSMEQELKTKELEAACSERIKTEKESFLHITKEKDKMLEKLQKEVEWLEQESFRRELEGAVFTQIWSEGTFEDERQNLVLLVEEKDQMIDDLLQQVRSLEQKFNGSLNSFSSQIAEKQAQINLVYEAWEKIATAEILAELEIEEKKLMIFELEDDVCKIQQKLELQEKSLSSTKQRALEIETELDTKQLQMKTLSDRVEEKLRISDSLINELKNEKRSLVEDVMKLSSERENLLSFIGGLGDKINEFSIEDMQLMGNLGRILQSVQSSESDEALEGNDELFNSVKENMNTHPSPTSKNSGYTLERSPFKQLN